MMILGAGISGLLAAHSFPTAEIREARGEQSIAHLALLRFRSPHVGDAVGIEFQRVIVHKGIWLNGQFVSPDIRTANLYARKVAGALNDRSVWNVETVERWVAPDDFIPQMIRQVHPRIHWDAPVTSLAEVPRPLISTMPMMVLAKAMGLSSLLQGEVFQHAPIVVGRYAVRNANVYQTVYFPSPSTPVYRASITGSMLIIEAMQPYTRLDLDGVLTAFGLEDSDITEIGSLHTQRYGKIVPIAEGVRRSFIHAATRDSVYALGRFATWRNVLTDDVLHDIAVIKRLLKTDPYERNLIGEPS